ncbi:hypothetical protein NN561_011233 [Cricetulus griseus]
MLSSSRPYQLGIPRFGSQTLRFSHEALETAGKQTAAARRGLQARGCQPSRRTPDRASARRGRGAEPPAQPQKRPRRLPGQAGPTVA